MEQKYSQLSIKFSFFVVAIDHAVTCDVLYVDSDRNFLNKQNETYFKIGQGEGQNSEDVTSSQVGHKAVTVWAAASLLGVRFEESEVEVWSIIDWSLLHLGV
jgi:hypothetical protein